MDQNLTGTAYLQVVPDTYMRCKVVRATQRRPNVSDPESVIVKIKLSIPREAFDPLEPDTEIVVPVSNVQHPVIVEAEDAHGDE